MYALKKLNKLFSCFLENSLIVLLVGISVLQVIQVILRYVFHLPMQSIEEILVIPSIWFYFLGATLASVKEEHINARLLEIFMKKERSIYIIRTLCAAVGVVVTLWLGYWAFDLAKYSIRVAKLSLILKYPLSIIEVALFITMIFMFIYTVFEFFKYWKLATEKQGGEK